MTTTKTLTLSDQAQAVADRLNADLISEGARARDITWSGEMFLSAQGDLYFHMNIPGTWSGLLWVSNSQTVTGNLLSFENDDMIDMMEARN